MPPAAAPLRLRLPFVRRAPARPAARAGSRLLVAGVSVLGLLLTAGCREAPPPPPSVVLVTVDTLRADRLGAYGGSGTPHMDRMAADAVLFENAIAPMPVTRPSHFTLFTGRYPRQHGVVDNHLKLPASELTLAEVLSAAGYRTAAFTGVSILNARSGSAQGFATFDSPAARERRAAEVVERALAWLETVPAGERFFLWIHVFDPHIAYEPLAAFRPPGGEGPLAEAATWESLREIAQANGGEIGRAELRRIRALYAAEVSGVDAVIGALEIALAERPDARDLVTVLTADHGECFGHGIYFRHASCLYDGAIRVPLLMRYPRLLPAGQRVAEQVEHRDLAPTLLALAAGERGAGPETPESFRGGRVLFDPSGRPVAAGEETFALLQHPLSSLKGERGRRSLWRGIERVAGDPVRDDVRGEEQVGLRSARWKYIVTAGREELYDLAADPDESHDLAGAEPRTVRRLRAELRAQLERYPLNILDPGEIDPVLLERLRALGYL